MPVLWNGKSRQIYFEGGPHFVDLGNQAEVISTYPNGQVAAARSKLGKGRVFVAGFHPEAPQFWREYYNLEDPDGTDFELVDEMIRWSMGAQN